VGLHKGICYQAWVPGRCWRFQDRQVYRKAGLFKIPQTDALIPWI